MGIDSCTSVKCCVAEKSSEEKQTVFTFPYCFLLNLSEEALNFDLYPNLIMKAVC